MTYVVDEKCIKCKHMDCVEVCPVDCFYEGENMLVIHPDECIDCGVCEPECPAEAILSDTEDGIEKWAEINRKYSEIWPNINEKKDPPPDAEKWQNVKDKYNKAFRDFSDFYKKECLRDKIDYNLISTSDSLDKTLLQYLIRRSQINK